MKTTALIVIALTSRCVAQMPEIFTTTAGELSGYYWRSLSFNEKVTFVYGYQAGYLSASPTNKVAVEQAEKSCLGKLSNPTSDQRTDCALKSMGTKSEEYKYWESHDPMPGGTYGETVNATDRFFEEPENRVMPIGCAWTLAKWRREGRKLSEIEELLDMYRETFIRIPRKACEDGEGAWIALTASRCAALGTTLKPKVPTAK